MYQEMLLTYEATTPIQRDLYKNICVASLKANEAISQNKASDFERYRKNQLVLQMMPKSNQFKRLDLTRAPLLIRAIIEKLENKDLFLKQLKNLKM